MRLSTQFLLQMAIILFAAIFYSETATTECDKSLIKQKPPPAPQADYDNTSNKLKCQDDKLVIKIDAKLYNEVTCDKNGGWKEGDNVIAQATKEITIECVKICEDETSPAEVKRAGDAFLFTFSCESDKTALRVLSYQNTEYPTITCDKDGWTVGSAKIESADKKLAVTCKKYCEVTGTPANNFESTLADSKIEINCKNKKYALHEKQGNKMLTANTECSVKDGWRNSGMSPAPDHKIALDAECKEVCIYDANDADLKFDATSNTLTCNAPANQLAVGGVYYSQLTCDAYKGWADANPALPSTNTLSVTCNVPACKFTFAPTPPSTPPLVVNTATTPGKAEVACIEKKFNRNNNGLKYKIPNKEAFSHSNLICDSDGWKDEENNILFPATTEPEFSCVDNPCSVQKAICGSFTAPNGYECITSPFDREGDPNVATCDANDILWLDDSTIVEEEEKFIDKKLRCQEVEEDGKKIGKWRKFGEDTILMSETNKIACIKKLCNKCSAPPLSDPTTGVNPITPTAATFTEGTSTECATITCPNDLWLIEVTREKDGSDEKQTEQYVGPITCASEKERDSQWTIVEINGESKVKSVDKVGCITEVKCTEAAKIIIDCDPNWTGGCDKIGDPAGLSDTTENKCPAGKQIYFKQPMDAYFGESTGGDLIKCDKDRGVWEMMKSDDKKGDVTKGMAVVCATENPKPVPPKPACEGCDANDSNVKVSSPDNKTCTATAFEGFELNVNGKVVDKLECTNGNWTHDGKLVDKNAFSAQAKKDQEGESVSPFIMAGGVVGGVALVLIIFVVIFKVFISKKRITATEEETKRLDEEKKKKKKKSKRGENDEILEEVDIEAPADLLL